MFIKELVLEGFKSYATRTVISGFDAHFNAITGLNGTGKSNILDAICFVLGISNLSQVRVGNLQELVYKQGQAGVTKASVTVVFDNSDTASSPVGYEAYDTITVARQIAIGGRNKYLINGHAATVTRVQNLFHSVQLNVNNPHFLIMQGRITKVLNMKPPEILGMIEEAAGTRMFETKKQAALRTIAKKQTKVDEINTVLANEIHPNLEKLRKDRATYLQWAANNTRCERLARFCIAADYTEALRTHETAAGDLRALETDLAAARAAVTAARERAVAAERDMARFEADKARGLAGDYAALVAREEDASKKLVQTTTVWTHAKATRDEEVARRDADRRAEEEARAELAALETAAATLAAAEERARAVLDEARAALERAEAAFQAACSGFESAADGEVEDDALLAAEEEADAAAAAETEGAGAARRKGGKKGSAAAAAVAAAAAAASSSSSTSSGPARTVQDRLARMRSRVERLRSDVETAQMRELHLRAEAKESHKSLASARGEHEGLLREVERAAAKLATLRERAAAHGFDADREATLKGRRTALQRELQALEEALDAAWTAVGPGVQFEYDAAGLGRGWDPSRVKGVVAQLLRVHAPDASTALEVAAGGKLYNVVVDTEATGAELLKKGRLARRVTIIPLNKIRRGTIAPELARRAESKTGGRAVPALSLVGFDDDVRAAMEFVFGHHFICADSDAARTIAFDPAIRTPAVTHMGDAFDPHGTLEGGSESPSGGVLRKLHDLHEREEARDAARAALAEVERELAAMSEVARTYAKAAGEVEVAEHQWRLAQSRADASLFAQATERARLAEAQADAESATVTAKRAALADAERACAALEGAVRDLDKRREAALETSRTARAHAQDAALAAEKAHRTAAQKRRAAELERDQAAREVTSAVQAAQASEKSAREAEAAEAKAAAAATTARAAYEEAASKLGERRAALAAMDEGHREALARRSAAQTEEHEAEQRAKSLDHKRAGRQKEVASSARFVEVLVRKHPWIETEKAFFGKPGTDYDFAAQEPREAAAELKRLESEQSRLGAGLNKRVLGMLETAEKEYRELVQKRQIVENDKLKIERVIAELDHKKNEALRTTWGRVNRDFGSIFSTLLPGTSAKLEPPEGCTVLDGLEVRVAFHSVWKESLSELSGGQRSLLALSLILALLLFKPAPMYILDEVDAALDLSHTQNIGLMLRTHFAHSQFLVVSLKEGMFNNANVIFRTKFVDGVSAVTRTIPAGAAAGGGGAGGGGSTALALPRSTAEASRRAATSAAFEATATTTVSSSASSSATSAAGAAGGGGVRGGRKAKATKKGGRVGDDEDEDEDEAEMFEGDSDGADEGFDFGSEDEDEDEEEDENAGGRRAGGKRAKTMPEAKAKAKTKAAVGGRRGRGGATATVVGDDDEEEAEA